MTKDDQERSALRLDRCHEALASGRWVTDGEVEDYLTDLAAEVEHGDVCWTDVDDLTRLIGQLRSLANRVDSWRRKLAEMETS